LVLKFLENNEEFKKTDGMKVAIEDRIVVDLDSLPTTKGFSTSSKASVYKFAISKTTGQRKGKEVAYGHL